MPVSRNSNSKDPLELLSITNNTRNVGYIVFHTEDISLKCEENRIMKLNNTRSTNRMLHLGIMENRVLPLSQSIYSQTLNTMHISKISVSKHVVWKTGFSQDTNTFHFNEIGLMISNFNLLLPFLSSIWLVFLEFLYYKWRHSWNSKIHRRRIKACNNRIVFSNYISTVTSM